MRHVRMPALVVVAALAIMAVAVTAALAAKPEWGQCYAKASGKYANANCTTKAKKGDGAYEWRKGTEIAKKGFTGAGGRGLLYTSTTPCKSACVNEKGEVTQEGKEFKEKETFFPASVECASETATGEASGKNDVKNVHVTFKGCVFFETFPCSNTANSGEIDTSVLKGELGIIEKAKNEVGVMLTPETKKGTFAKFSCTVGLSTEVGVVAKRGGPPAYPPKGGNDEIISPITPIDEMSSSFTQEYKAANLRDGLYCYHCYNIPENFEKKPQATLEAYIYNTETPQNKSFWEPAAEEITNVNTPEEAVEIRG